MVPTKEQCPVFLLAKRMPRYEGMYSELCIYAPSRTIAGHPLFGPHGCCAFLGGGVPKSMNDRSAAWSVVREWHGAAKWMTTTISHATGSV